MILCFLIMTVGNYCRDCCLFFEMTFWEKLFFEMVRWLNLFFEMMRRPPPLPPPPRFVWEKCIDLWWISEHVISNIYFLLIWNTGFVHIRIGSVEWTEILNVHKIFLYWCKIKWSYNPLNPQIYKCVMYRNIYNPLARLIHSN